MYVREKNTFILPTIYPETPEQAALFGIDDCEVDYDEHFVDYGDEPEQLEEEFVAFNLSISDGHGILDGGATKTAGGIAQLESLQQCYL